MQTARENDRMAMHLSSQADGTYELRIVVPRQEREPTIAVLKENGVDKPLELLQESVGLSEFTTLIATIATLGLKDIVVALIQRNQGKQVKVTRDGEVVFTGYAAKEIPELAKAVEGLAALKPGEANSQLPSPEKEDTPQD